jgi:hypothetical protein
MNQPQTSTPDFRTFGFTEDGQLRANLYNGTNSPDAGALYSWVCADTDRQLANKLADQWEEPLTDEEWDVLEQLEAAAEVEIDCEYCGGSGRDPGSLNPFEPEDCPECNGTGRETIAPVSLRRPAGREVAIPSTRKEVA